jgi:hypothetical protein
LWFAGVPVVGERPLDVSEGDRLVEVARVIRDNILTTAALLITAAVGLAIVSALSFAIGWLGPILLSITSAVIRLVPARRLYSPRTLLALRKDRKERLVYVCQEDDAQLEVLKHSRLIWRRFGMPASDISIAHGRWTAEVPEHAGMAAQFVRPIGAAGEYHAHRRALTAEELAELDSCAPLPNVLVMIVAIVSSVGCLIGITYFARGIFSTLLPAALF